MVAAAEHTSGVADLKFLHHKRPIPFRNFKWRSGTGMIGLTGARDFSKFVKGER